MSEFQRSLPATVPAGFVRSTGIPNTSSSKPYFSTTAEALRRAIADPRCVGISAQRLFYGTVGNPATVVGRAGEDECFLRS